ncbi:MAG TPA: glycosyltransferase, partial [Aggregatilineales bacterium]|nr:glycosyltransferase [Aggregatilineales bacterium]
SGYPKLLQPWTILRQGRALFAQRHYDLVSSHDYGLFLNGIGAWLLTRGTGVPYVSEIHHVEGYPRAATVRERMYCLIAKIYIRWMWRRAAAIRVVNSVEMPRLLVQLGVPAEKTLILPSLYIDFEIFHPIPGEPCQFDVLFVGRFVPNKGLFTLLEAVAALQKTSLQVRLGLVGRGPLESAVQDKIQSLGLNDVTHIPRLEGAQEVARVYNRARMLVCASTSEGGPRVTVEAMACAVPVISTPVGVMTELLEDGVNGLLFHWDAHELANKIRRLLDDEALAARLGEAGRQSVQPFAAQRVIEQYARGYQALAARKGTS